MFTSTSPRELFLPMMILFCRTIYSNSRPSKRAMTSPLTSEPHCTFEGLAGADFKAKRAHASLSCVLEYVDISKHTQNTPHFTGIRYRAVHVQVGSPCLPTKDKRGRHLHYSATLDFILGRSFRTTTTTRPATCRMIRKF